MPSSILPIVLYWFFAEIISLILSFFAKVTNGKLALPRFSTEKLGRFFSEFCRISSISSSIVSF